MLSAIIKEAISFTAGVPPVIGAFVVKEETSFTEEVSLYVVFHRGRAANQRRRLGNAVCQ